MNSQNTLTLLAVFTSVCQAFVAGCSNTVVLEPDGGGSGGEAGDSASGGAVSGEGGCGLSGCGPCAEIDGECVACDRGLWQGDVTLADDEVGPYVGYTGISGSLKVSGTVSSLRSLSCLAQVGTLDVRGTSALQDLRGLEGLTEVEGDLIISERHCDSGGGGDTKGPSDWKGPNMKLSALEGLASIESVGGDLVIGCNPLLERVEGLDTLATVGGDVVISKASLTSLEGLGGLATVAGQVTIGWNDSLVSVQGLDNLRIVVGGLRLMWNPALTNLHGLEALTEVGDPTVGTVTGAVEIESNVALLDAGALMGITSFDLAVFRATNNRSLPTCQADALAAHFAEVGLIGMSIIHGNDDDGVCR